jgi:hypothetical protein
LDNQFIDNMWDVVVKLVHGPAWKWTVSAAVGLFAVLFGTKVHPILTAAFVCYCFDWFLGVGYGLITRSLSSSKSLRGVIKFLVYGGVILVAEQLTRIRLIGIDGGLMIEGVIHTLILVTEAQSNVENLGKICDHFGVDIPWLKLLGHFLEEQRDRELKKLAEETAAVKEETTSAETGA